MMTKSNLHGKAAAVSASAVDKVNIPTGAPGKTTAHARKANASLGPSRTDVPTEKAVPTVKVAPKEKAVPTAKDDPKETDRNKDVPAATVDGKRSPNSAAPSRRGPDFKFGLTAGTYRGKLL